MNKTAYLILSLFLSLFIASSCNKKEMPELEHQQEGANIDLSISLTDINPSVDFSLQTKSLSSESTYEDYVSHANSDTIHSLAFFLLDISNPNLHTGHILAYRLFIKDSEDNNKWLFRNTSNWEYHDGGGIMPNVELTQVTGYSNGNDDSTPEGSVYGYNGIADDGLSAHVHLNYDYPLHGNTEKIKVGEYLVCMIANFTETPSLIKGHVLAWHIHQAIEYWQEHQNDPVFNGVPEELPTPEGDYNGFGNMIYFGRLILSDAEIIHQGSDFTQDIIEGPTVIRNKSTDISSTGHYDILVHSGDNHFDWLLKRTVSRVTFNVQNYSETPFKINRFTLSNEFASNAVLLFPNLRSGEFHDSWEGIPLTTSEKALKPFDPTTLYNVQGEREIFFDALIFPSQNLHKQMSFDIEVELPDVTDPDAGEDGYRNKFSNNDYITFASLCQELNNDNVWPVGTGRMFMFKSVLTFKKQVNGTYRDLNKPFFEVINDSQTPNVNTTYTSFETMLAAINNDLTMTNSLWEFIKVEGSNPTYGNKQFIIKNVKINKYIKINGNSGSGVDLLYDSSPNNASVFTINNFDGYQIQGGSKVSVSTDAVAFVSSYGGKEVYLNVINYGQQVRNGSLVSLEKWCDAGSHFYMYEIIFETHSDHLTKSVNVPIYVMNSFDGQSHPLHTINRNEHIIVDVNIRYNSVEQEFDISTVLWNESQNHVTFD